MLQAVKPNTKPSPEPIQHLPPIEKRRPRATQADQVLIDTLANHNRPDIAKLAGETPLAVEESEGESADEMDTDELKESRELEAVAIAQDASSILEDRPDISASPPHEISSPTTESRLPPVPTNPQGIDRDVSIDYRDKLAESQVDNRDHFATNERKQSIPVKEALRHDFPRLSGQRSNIANEPMPDLKAKATSTSTNRPQYYPPVVAEGTPMESQTLPALQNTHHHDPRAPNGQQSLPSLASLNIMTRRDPDSSSRPGGIGNQNLPALSTSNGNVHSPRNGTFPSISPFVPIQRTITGTFPASQPSPASTLSQPSPRDSHGKGPEQSAMSPPDKYPTQYASPNAPPLGSNAPPTPSSIDSSPSFINSNSEMSPNGDQLSMDESTRKLPPLSASAPVNGAFKCDHTGCTAPPFQTQYLLKYVNQNPIRDGIS